MRIKLQLTLLVVIATLSLPFLTHTSKGQPYLRFSELHPSKPEIYAQAFDRMVREWRTRGPLQDEDKRAHDTSSIRSWQDSEGRWYFSNETTPGSTQHKTVTNSNIVTFDQTVFGSYKTLAATLVIALFGSLILFTLLDWLLKGVWRAGKSVLGINKKPDLFSSINHKNNNNSDQNQRSSKTHEDYFEYSTGATPAVDPYQILGVTAYATNEEIKAAYKKQIAQYHPDRVANMGPELREIAEERSSTINQAFQILKDERGF